METAKTEQIKVGSAGAVIGILATLLISGLSLTQDQFNNAYVCSVNDQVGIFFGGVSGTGYTGYPDKDSTKGYVRCIQDDKKGIWEKLEVVAKRKGIDPMVLLQQSKNETIKYVDRIIVQKERYVFDENNPQNSAVQVNATPIKVLKLYNVDGQNAECHIPENGVDANGFVDCVNADGSHFYLGEKI